MGSCSKGEGQGGVGVQDTSRHTQLVFPLECGKNTQHAGSVTGQGWNSSLDTFGGLASTIDKHKLLLFLNR